MNSAFSIFRGREQHSQRTSQIRPPLPPHSPGNSHVGPPHTHNTARHAGSIAKCAPAIATLALVLVRVVILLALESERVVLGKAPRTCMRDHGSALGTERHTHLIAHLRAVSAQKHHFVHTTPRAYAEMANAAVLLFPRC
ncbi:hypothetical protein FI667_g15418, partial [Globisporangium splendens]